MGVCCSAGTDKERDDDHEDEHQAAGEPEIREVLSPEQRKYMLRAVLERMQVTELLLPCAVITVESTSGLSQAWGRLLDKGLSAAPVWSEAKQQYLGFLEIQDAVSYIVRLAEAEHRSRGQCLNSLASSALQDFVATPRHLVRPTSQALAGSAVADLDQMRDTTLLGISPELYRTLSPAEVGAVATPRIRQVS